MKWLKPWGFNGSMTRNSTLLGYLWREWFITHEPWVISPGVLCMHTDSTYYKDMQPVNTHLNVWLKSSLSCLLIQVSCVSLRKWPCYFHNCLILWWSLPSHLSHFHTKEQSPHTFPLHTESSSWTESPLTQYKLAVCMTHHYTNVEIHWVSDI